MQLAERSTGLGPNNPGPKFFGPFLWHLTPVQSDLKSKKLVCPNTHFNRVKIESSFSVPEKGGLLAAWVEYWGFIYSAKVTKMEKAHLLLDLSDKTAAKPQLRAGILKFYGMHRFVRVHIVTFLICRNFKWCFS